MGLYSSIGEKLTALILGRILLNILLSYSFYDRSIPIEILLQLQGFMDYSKSQSYSSQPSTENRHSNQKPQACNPDSYSNHRKQLYISAFPFQQPHKLICQMWVSQSSPSPLLNHPSSFQDYCHLDVSYHPLISLQLAPSSLILFPPNALFWSPPQSIHLLCYPIRFCSHLHHSAWPAATFFDP